MMRHDVQKYNDHASLGPEGNLRKRTSRNDDADRGFVQT
jgi:hypothetical protein